MKGGDPQIRSEGGVFCQSLQSCICTCLLKTNPMMGQKVPGSNAGCPAGTNTRTTLVPRQAGTFRFFQFGLNIDDGLYPFK
jgi:hypothetical protein